MEKFLEAGTDVAALHVTFRLILKDATSVKVMSPKDASGKSVMPEPIALQWQSRSSAARNKWKPWNRDF